MLTKLFKKKQCKHVNSKIITNIYGDLLGNNKYNSVKICLDCHKIFFSEDKENTIRNPHYNDNF